MFDYLKIYRLFNVVFIVFAQLCCAYFLVNQMAFSELWEYGFHYFLLGSACISFFGYWLNDHLDRERDELNQSSKVGIQYISTNVVYIHLLVFASVALYCANQLPIEVSMVFSLSLFFLMLYNIWLKNYALIGNLVVAALAFVSIYCLIWMFPDEINEHILLHFAVLSGLVTLAREITKDAEDLEGDKLTNAKTLPIVAGVKVSNSVVYVITLFVLSFVFISLYYQKIYFETSLRYLYYAYYALFVVIPLYYACLQIRDAKTKEQFTEVSSIYKYVLAVGILSILFF